MYPEDITLNPNAQPDSTEQTVEQTTVQQTAAPVQPQVQQAQPNIDEDIMKFAKAFHMVQQETQKQQAEVLHNQQLEKEMSFRDTSGQSIAEFHKKIKDELARGETVDFDYYPELAKKYGNVAKITVSGYTMSFLKGKTHKVPKSLLPEVRLRFGMVNLLGKEKTLIAYDENEQEDEKLKQQAASIISQKFHVAVE